MLDGNGPPGYVLEQEYMDPAGERATRALLPIRTQGMLGVAIHTRQQRGPEVPEYSGRDEAEVVDNYGPILRGQLPGV